MEAPFLGLTVQSFIRDFTKPNRSDYGSPIRIKSSMENLDGSAYLARYFFGIWTCLGQWFWPWNWRATLDGMWSFGRKMGFVRRQLLTERVFRAYGSVCYTFFKTGLKVDYTGNGSIVAMRLSFAGHWTYRLAILLGLASKSPMTKSPFWRVMGGSTEGLKPAQLYASGFNSIARAFDGHLTRGSRSLDWWFGDSIIPGNPNALTFGSHLCSFAPNQGIRGIFWGVRFYDSVGEVVEGLGMIFGNGSQLIRQEGF